MKLFFSTFALFFTIFVHAIPPPNEDFLQISTKEIAEKFESLLEPNRKLPSIPTKKRKFQASGHVQTENENRNNEHVLAIKAPQEAPLKASEDFSQFEHSTMSSDEHSFESDSDEELDVFDNEAVSQNLMSPRQLELELRIAKLNMLDASAESSENRNIDQVNEMWKTHMNEKSNPTEKKRRVTFHPSV